MVKLDIKDPLQLARWLETVEATIERQKNVFKVRWGADSAAVAQLTNELTELQKLRTSLTQLSLPIK